MNTDSTIVLYHGSRQGLQGPVAPVSRTACNFGAGFYMGTAAEQSLSLLVNETDPVLYTVELSLDGLRILDLEADIT